MNTTTARRVVLAVDNNQGYAADQVETRMTLGDLLATIEQAVADFGEDALVVTRDTGNRYGANWGRLDQWAEVADADDEDGDSDEF